MVYINLKKKKYIYTYKVIYRAKYTVRCCDMVQYNNMTSPGGVIYSRIAYHFLILLAQKLGTPNSRDSPDAQEKA